ncbi:RDD family protein [Shewanella marisflavi]|uniref:RDD family protein n=1 Tax=Shewanella marisflavi TaxID=260364 RepID=UPI0024B0C8BB|nr:RDD family protein [Shewanella marisflavi]
MKGPKNKDPKTIVTPFAFHVAPEVLYTPLASPLKRGLAMLIDALLVSVLAEQAGALFILLVGLTLVIERRSHQLGKAFKWVLYLSMLLMTIWVTSDNIISHSERENERQKGQQNVLQVDSLSTLKLMPQLLALSVCEEVSCADDQLTQLLAELDQLQANDSEKVALATQLIKELSLPAQDKDALMQRLARAYPNVEDDAKATLVTDVTLDDATQVVTQDATSTAEPHDQEASEKLNSLVVDPDQMDDDKPSPYSLLEWAKGILNDLGLGFGWAAFYFTVFTAWFDGQTLGKKLLNIRVIPLDASAISLWDAFGRYGGYGAGFATGLLGFLQIFWDANRQAIQDKISETVVIDLSKSRDQDHR